MEAIEEKQATSGAGEAEAPKGKRDVPAAIASRVDDLMSAVKRLENFATTEAKRAQARFEPIEEKARENFWTTVLMALGLGVILGLLIGAGRRRDG